MASFSARKMQLGLLSSTASGATAEMHHKLGPLYMQKGKSCLLADGFTTPALRPSVHYFYPCIYSVFNPRFSKCLCLLVMTAVVFRSLGLVCLFVLSSALIVFCDNFLKLVGCDQAQSICYVMGLKISFHRFGTFREYIKKAHPESVNND